MDLTKKIDLGQRTDILTFALIVILAVLVGYNIIYKSQTNEIDLIQSRIEEEKRKNEVLEVISLMEQKLQTFEKRFFSSTEVTQLIDKVSELARQAEIAIETFNPQPVEYQEQYIELPLEIVMRCDYHQLGKLLSLIESNQEIILVKQLTMKKSTVQVTQQSGIPKVGLTVSGLYLKK